MRSVAESSSETKNRRVAQIDPLSVTESLGFQTFRRDSRKPWSKEEDAALVAVINELFPKSDGEIEEEAIKWDHVAQRISLDGSRKPKDCRKRWCNSLNPSLKKGKWTKEEDEQLLNAYSKYGASWQKVSGEIVGRTDDQCAKRYIEVLDPNTRDRLKPWDRDEDIKLIRLVKAHGTKWRTIANELKGRPSLTCRNRWRKLVTEVARGKANQVIKKEVDMVNERNSHHPIDVYQLTTSEDNTFSDSHFAHSDNQGRYDSGNNSDKFLSTPTFRRPPASGISRPTDNRVEWTYTLSGEDSNGPPLPHHQVFNDDNNGVIKNQELAQSLISYARDHGLKVDVHQHIHHHYSPPNREVNNSFHSFPQPLYAPVSTLNDYPMNRPDLFVDSEPLKSRYQHFNYLPPLTEVPKLHSSKSPETTSDVETAHFHHHHHHHHHHNVDSRNRDSANKYSNQPNQSSTGIDKAATGDSIRSDTLTPLTHAVELVAAAEANNKRAPEGALSDSKRQKNQRVIDEMQEESIGFWNAMKSLGGNSSSHTNNSELQDRPVSQHHPLHYNSSRIDSPSYAARADPQHPSGFDGKKESPINQESRQEQHNSADLDEDELDEDLFNTYGIFSSLYAKEGSYRPTTPLRLQYDENMVNIYDTIPFNPS